MIKNILVPKDRISVIIGKNGYTKRKIEKMTNTNLEINDNVVSIEGDGLDEVVCESIVKAISRGFSPETALKLKDESKCFFSIPLPNDRKTLIRVRARIIGTKGKAKMNIERLTNTSLSIYGKTVSMIGDYEDVEGARAAIEKLISGTPHKLVYQYLESKK